MVRHSDDRDLAVLLAEALAAKYDQQSLSLDKVFYSKANKDAIRLLVLEVVMPKKGSLSADDRLEESGREFKALRNRHSAVESNINQLEHNGLNKCPNVGFEAFKRYSALGVLSYNLHRLGSALLGQERNKQAQAPPWTLPKAA